MIEKNVNLPGLTVWCGISSVEIISPYFFDGCVTGKSYLKVLQHFLIPCLAHYDNDIMFQQDSAPPHFASVFRDFLDKKFPGRWIGRRGPIEWPARLPNLTWGVLKDKVYSRNPITLDQLRSLISQQLQTIDEAFAEKCVGLCETEWQSAFKTKDDTLNIFFSLHYPHLFAQCDL